MSSVEHTHRILDCPCIAVADDQEAISALHMMVRDGGGYSIAINAEKILFYRSRPDIRDVIDGAKFPYPDGIFKIPNPIKAPIK